MNFFLSEVQACSQTTVRVQQTRFWSHSLKPVCNCRQLRNCSWSHCSIKGGYSFTETATSLWNVLSHWETKVGKQQEMVIWLLHIGKFKPQHGAHHSPLLLTSTLSFPGSGSRRGSSRDTLVDGDDHPCQSVALRQHPQLASRMDQPWVYKVINQQLQKMHQKQHA